MSDTTLHLAGDHLALRRVQLWPYEDRVLFGRELQRLWLDRFNARTKRDDEPLVAMDILLCQMYLPGDYQLAEEHVWSEFKGGGK